MFQTIISCRELSVLCDDPNLVVVDTRSDLFDPAKGRDMFVAGHIPGALFADLNLDLSDRSDPKRGRHPLPSADVFAEKAGRWGIDHLAQVVVYDQRDGMYASRLWWMLKYFGHDAVAVLDGGLDHWVSEGRPVESEIRHPTTRVFTPNIRSERVATVDLVDSLRTDQAYKVVDSRAAERYRGEIEPIDPVAGHIPGAVNFPERQTVTSAGLHLAPDELAGRFDELLAGVAPENAIFYCGSGVTACHNLLAMEIAGKRGARLYPGSWSEWCADESRPVATGSGPD